MFSNLIRINKASPLFLKVEHKKRNHLQYKQTSTKIFKKIKIQTIMIPKIVNKIFKTPILMIKTKMKTKTKMIVMKNQMKSTFTNQRNHPSYPKKSACPQP